MNLPLIKNKYFDNEPQFTEIDFTKHHFLNGKDHPGGWSMQKYAGGKLHQIVRDAAPEAMLEIGTYYGWSTAYILAAMEETGGYLWTMETGLEHIVQANMTLSKMPKNFFMYEILQETTRSTKFDTDIDCCFIDGDHEYDWVRDDLNFCLSRMPEAGLFLCHDYAVGESVRKAVDEFVEQHPEFLTRFIRARAFTHGLYMMLKEK